MFGNNFTLFTIMGFRVRANVSWLFLALLVTWSLAEGFFPDVYPDLRPIAYWSLGICGMVGLFFSLLFHEFSHSLVARARGMPIAGITLFLFGGVAEMQAEPPDPRTEFQVAIAGPLASVALAVLFYALTLLLAASEAPDYIAGVAEYLALINLLLAAFNMVPGFPLDGGRILRAALWAWKKDLHVATRWASGVGQAFGLVLVGLGILAVLSGNFIGGLWWFLIGLFVRSAAQGAYQQMVAQQALKGLSASRLMSRDLVTVPAGTTIHAFIEDYLYRHDYDMFPVVKDGRLVACATLREVKAVPREQWDRVTVDDVCETCAESNTIAAYTPAVDVLALMRQRRNGRLLVMEGDRLVGVLTLKDLLHYLDIREELEEK